MPVFATRIRFDSFRCYVLTFILYFNSPTLHWLFAPVFVGELNGNLWFAYVVMALKTMRPTMGNDAIATTNTYYIEEEKKYHPSSVCLAQQPFGQM